MLPTPTGGRPPVRCHSGIARGRATSLGARPSLGEMPIVSHEEMNKNSQHSSLVTYFD
ncbi:hypothetical protein CsSME_00039537 [Camellia sinensis var. sinensis]